jgi:hypothetical protein
MAEDRAPLTDSDLKDIAQREATGGPKVGEVYRHWKGGIYSIVARAIREDTLEPVVIYRSNLKGTNWERTVANFMESVVVDDMARLRFARVAD